MKRVVIVSSFLALSGCVSINRDPPKQVANACSMLDEKQKWDDHVFAASYKWKISPGTILAIMKQESGFRHNAVPLDSKGKPLSSALGYSQALDGTWNDYVKENGKAKRKDFGDSADFIGWYADRMEKQAKISKSDTYNLYLAFHEGAGGFKKATYKNKAWLLGVASKVDRQAEVYDTQLNQCEKKKMKKFVKMADK